MTLITKTRAQGSSLVTTLPSEMVRRLGIDAGAALAWVEDGMGGFRVTPHTAGDERLLDAHENVMTKYATVFRKLAE